MVYAEDLPFLHAMEAVGWRVIWHKFASLWHSGRGTFVLHTRLFWRGCATRFSCRRAHWAPAGCVPSDTTGGPFQTDSRRPEGSVSDFIMWPMNVCNGGPGDAKYSRE